jgi:hypothetical protein
MAIRDHRVFRFFLVLLLVLAISALSVASAQSTTLSQIAQTLDGQISIRLPQNWMARDTAATTLTAVIAFGDTAESLQAMIDSLRGVEPGAAARMNGVIGIIDPQILTGLSTDLAMSTMLNSMISTVQNGGGQVEEQQSVMMGNLYPASVAVVSIPGTEGKGIIGVFQAGSHIVQFSMGASPERSFEANRQMFIDMMNSIRVPAETGSSLAPTAAIATAIPVQQTGDEAQTVSATGLFSVSLPSGWVQQEFVLTGFADLLAFGSSQANVQTIIALFTSSEQVEPFDGIGGFVGVIDPAQLTSQSLDALVSPLMQQILTSIQNEAVEIIEPAAAHTFGGHYAGELTLTNLGYIAVLHTDEQLLVSVIMSNNLDTNRTTMSGILETIHIPAESGEQQAALLAAAQTVRSSDGQVSLEIPGDWIVLDHVADENIFAYGDDETAAQSRLYSANPNLAPETAIVGNGGLIILYPMSQFSIDPQEPDLGSLMESALGGLQGYTVEQAAQPLEGGGLYALISGTERGYLALIPFGDEIAYVTATGTQATFDATDSILLDAVQSVRVPAASEDGGIGGLEGLQAEATETPAGLGGL